MVKKQKSTKKTPKVRIAEPGGRPFQIRYTCPIEKREIRLSVGSRDREEAEQLKSEVEARLLLGLEVQTRKEQVHGPEMDWESFREAYRTHHLSTLRDKSAAAAESRLDIAERILNPKTLGEMSESARLQTLQTRLLAGDHSRKKKRRSSHTVRGYMKAVVAALNWAYLQDWLPKQPKLPRIKVSKSKVMKGRPITAAEFEAMVKATPEVVGSEASDSWIFVLKGLWESALRIEELMHVSWDKPETIRPVWIKGQNPVLEIPAFLQKNDTEEQIPLLPGFEKLLLEVPEAKRKGWVFRPISLQLRLGRKFKVRRPDSEWVAKVISRIGAKAKVLVESGDETKGRSEKYASAHDLRRSCGERLRNAGVPPLVICRVLRHSSWETTRKHYAPGNVQSDSASIRRLLATR